MPIAIDIQHVGLVPKIGKAQVRQLKTSILRHIAGNWHATYSKGKFTPAAARKYQYAERKTKNVRTGQPKKSRSGKALSPNGNPLVWSGRSRGLAKTKKIRANSKRSSVTSPIRAFNFKPRGANPRLNMRREYTEVLPSEERKLGRDAEKIVRSMFSKGKTRINVNAG